MDFLSYKTLKILNDAKIVQHFSCDCIVLNSTSLVKKTVPFIGKYDRVFSYLDNDLAGEQAYNTVESLLPNAITQISVKFSEHKDLNDYLISSLQTK